MPVPFVPPGLTSGHTQELSRRREEAIESYRRQQPDIKAWEIRAALRLAARSSDEGRTARLAIAAGAATVIALGMAYMQRGRALTPEAEAQAPWMAAAVGGLILVLAAVFLLKRR